MGKVGQWLQVGANLGFLVGLILVGLQIQQSSHLTRGALFSTHMDGWLAIDLSDKSENFSNALARAILEPERLTDSEMLEVQGHIRSNIDQWSRQVVLYDLDIFQNSPKEGICSSVPTALGYEFAIAWWEENREEWGQELVKVIDECIAEYENLQSYELRKLRRLRAKMQPQN